LLVKVVAFRRMRWNVQVWSSHSHTLHRKNSNYDLKGWNCSSQYGDRHRT
jgi:hypothetical protein